MFDAKRLRKLRIAHSCRTKVWGVCIDVFVRPSVLPVILEMIFFLSVTRIFCAFRTIVLCAAKDHACNKVMLTHAAMGIIRVGE